MRALITTAFFGIVFAVNFAQAQTCSIPPGYIACASSTLTSAHATCGYRVVNGFCTLTTCMPGYSLVNGKCQLPPAVSFFSVDRSIQSGDYTLAIYAQLNRAPSGTVIVDLSTASSSALTDDYELLTPQAVFNNYQYSDPIFVKIKRNPGDLPNRTIAIKLANVSQGSAAISSSDTMTLTISAQASQSIQLAADDITVTAGQNALVKVHLSAVNSASFPTFVSARYYSGDGTAITTQQVDGSIPAGGTSTFLGFPTVSRTTPSVSIVKLSMRTASDILITKSIAIITVTAAPLNCIAPQVASGSSCVTPLPLTMNPSSGVSLYGGQSQQFMASGGLAPYYWSSDFGGRITLDGYYTANNSTGSSVVTLKDSKGTIVTTNVSITATTTLTVSPSSPPILDKSTSFKFNGIGGAPPYTWSVSGGGSIASDGTLLAPSSPAQVTITVQDSLHNTSSAVATIANPLSISPLNPSSSIVTGATLQFSAANGVAPYTWSATGGGTITSSGLLTAPSAPGALSVLLTDSRGKSVSSVVNIVSATCQALQHLSGGACVPDTFTPTFGSYSPSSLAACGGTVTGTRVISACIDDQTSASVATTNCTDPSPTTTISSPAGAQACAIANGAGTQSCSQGSSAPSACVVASCNPNFHQAGSSCVADTYTAAFSAYAASTVTAVCSGVQTASRSITTCSRDYDSLAMATSFCSDPSPTTTYQSPAGTQSCSVANGAGTQSCALGSSAPSTCLVDSCNSGFYASADNKTCVINPSISPTSWSMNSNATKQFSVSGGTAPYTWTASAGSVSSSGLFTPANSNGAQNVTVTDAAGHAASAVVTVTASFNLTLNQPSIGAISGASNGALAAGTSVTLTYSGANTSGSWTGACTSSLSSSCSFSMNANTTIGASVSCVSLFHQSGSSCIADTFAASYSAYSPTSLGVCGGTTTGTRTISACTDNQTGQSVATSNCSDPSPTTSIQSPAGWVYNECSVSGAASTQRYCNAGQGKGSSPSGCIASSCSSGLKLWAPDPNGWGYMQCVPAALWVYDNYFASYDANRMIFVFNNWISSNFGAVNVPLERYVSDGYGGGFWAGMSDGYGGAINTSMFWINPAVTGVEFGCGPYQLRVHLPANTVYDDYGNGNQDFTSYVNYYSPCGDGGGE